MARLFYCDYRVRLFVEIEVVVRRSFKQVIKNPNSFELRFDTWWSRRHFNWQDNQLIFIYILIRLFICAPISAPRLFRLVLAGLVFYFIVRVSIQLKM